MGSMIARTWYTSTPPNLPPVREWGGTKRTLRDMKIIVQADGDTQITGPRVKKGSYITGGRLRWKGTSGAASTGVFGGGKSVDITVTVGDSFTCNRFKLVQSLTYASCEAIERFDSTTLPFYCTCDMDVLVTIGNGTQATCTQVAGVAFTGLSIDGVFTSPFTSAPAPDAPLDPQFYGTPWIYLEVDVTEPEG